MKSPAKAGSQKPVPRPLRFRQVFCFISPVFRRYQATSTYRGRAQVHVPAANLQAPSLPKSGPLLGDSHAALVSPNLVGTMAFSTLFVVAFFALAGKTLAQDVDLSELFASGASPTGMLFDLLGDGDNFRVRDVLRLIPEAMRTQSEELKTSGASADETSGFDCNLSGVDPACFLIEFASKVAHVWCRISRPLILLVGISKL